MSAAPPRRAVVCHEWLTAIGGSDTVAFDLADLVAAEEMVVAAADDAVVAELVARRVDPPTVRSLFTSERMVRHHRELLPLLLWRWSRLDLSEYDLVVTSSHSALPALRRSRPDQVIVNYCHTPMRYAWRWREELDRFPAPVRPVWPAAAAGLRRLDARLGRHADVVVANSAFTRAVIADAWGREAEVVHPPVDTDYFTPPEGPRRGGYLLHVGRLVPYKRSPIAVEAATRLGCRLIVAGDGPQRARCEEVAGPGVEFLGHVERAELRELYRHADALVFPSREDFGMTPVEAMACGTPVIAAAEGGALETVVEGETGWLVEPTPSAFAEAMRTALDGWAGDRARIREHALDFGLAAFRRRMGRVLDLATV